MRAEQAGRIARKLYTGPDYMGLTQLMDYLELADMEETEALARIEDHSADL